MLKRLFIFLFLAGLGTSVLAQDSDESTENEQSEIDRKALRDSTKAQRKAWNQENTIFKPIIGVGVGVFNYFGEVNNNERTNPLINNYGFQASVIKNFTPSFGIRFDVAYGKITARERSIERNLNFSSDIVNFNLHATYNFAGILPPKRFLNPYISVGIGAINFDAKGDLKNEDGVSYNYWRDGTVRSVAQPPIGSSDPEPTAEILRADYVYETDLRKANLDSLGEYQQFAVSIPFTFGLNFRVSPRSIIRLSSTFSYTLTDLIDNYTRDGVEGRKGNAANDMFLFTAISYHFDFFSPKKVKKGKFDETEFFSLEGDSDGDGVANEIDHCPDSEKGSKVNENGCPMDSDGDGVIDDLDEEPATDPSLNVDARGVGITDDMLSLNEKDTLATLRAQMFEVYPELVDIYRAHHSKKRDSNSESIGDSFLSLDTDKNGILSVTEVYQAIDLFFDGELDVKAQYITDLIDFFFDQ